ncbi:30S ribosomal protein S9 [Porphyromonas sp. HMSC065F10]|uniref:30S ribosomal protein S9 n=1 Tax=Porphyromonas sp. HMSC065F10 TaxID=1739394 RepID=UPI0008A22225|nr:30S ribosomal protein S9 [Porphyromonas sp. HMSC065F10]OFR39101.1 30S ribosomal protein S9 [Porphyromonas sp. HMSC065F10]
MEVINALGRRKASVARVYLKEGSGKIMINKKALEDFFPNPFLIRIVRQPLALLGVEDRYDININVNGGGTTGQSEASRLGIARALVKVNPDDKAALRAAGFMTRDDRVVERKKPGQPGARRKFQFSKR